MNDQLLIVAIMSATILVSSSLSNPKVTVPVLSTTNNVGYYVNL